MQRTQLRFVLLLLLRCIRLFDGPLQDFDMSRVFDVFAAADKYVHGCASDGILCVDVSFLIDEELQKFGTGTIGATMMQKSASVRVGEHSFDGTHLGKRLSVATAQTIFKTASSRKSAKGQRLE